MPRADNLKSQKEKSSVGSFFSSMRNDISNTINFSKLSAGEQFQHKAKTAVTIARNKDEAAYYGGNDNPRPRQAALPMTVSAPNYGIAPVAAAPTVPDPNAIGETEQALLDQQKAGRSSTIQTSAKGLLSGEDDTRKRRSLMGGLIS